MSGRFYLYAKRLFFITAILVTFSCSGGGCSGCTGCGVAPIPGGFPIDQRIGNAMQMRLTESGISFIETNIAAIVASFLPGGLDFPVPHSTGSTTGIDYDLCPAPDW